jgi:Glycogen recognition site of AMP-activated protein kinase
VSAQPATSDARGEPIEGLSRLRQVDPPPALVARVMTRVAEPPAPTFWQWLLRPFRVELRISPLGAIGLSLGVVLGAALALAPRSHPRVVSAVRVAASEPAASAATGERHVMVHFALGAPGARHVSVAGSFNDWDPSALPLEDANADGVFEATVRLPRGLHEYMFVVDGQWVTDPAASERRPDGFGRQNALLRL